ncbi:UNVERIFIED_CONTAM: hypothetical protein RMT77_006000 [Armadillidium vulgare]
MFAKKVEMLWIIIIISAYSSLTSESKRIVDLCSVGKFQSPVVINISLRGTGVEFLKVYKDYFVDDFLFMNFEKSYKAVLSEEHNKYVISFTFTSTDPRPSITGGALGNDTFYLHKIFLHWYKPENEYGVSTEHVFDNHYYEGEIQLLTYNDKYESYEKAAKHSKSLAVFAVFIDSAFMDLSNLELQRFFQDLIDIHHEFKLELPRLFEELLPETFKPPNKDIFSVYEGSLTFPPCTETVKWILFDNAIQVPLELIGTLRKILPGNKLGARAIQDLNNRIFYFRHEKYNHEQYKGCTPHYEYNEKVYYQMFMKDFEQLPGNDSTPYCYEKSDCPYSPPKWKEVYKACGKPLQSPINIDQSLVKPMAINDDVFPKYIKTKSGFSFLPIIPSYFNKEIYIHFSKGENTWEVVNKLNGEEYVLSRIRILIGDERFGGSEHSINNKFYPFELQLINMNKKFHNLGQALNKPDGIFVISKFFETNLKYYKTITDESKEFKKILKPLSAFLRHLNGEKSENEDHVADMFVKDHLDINKLLGPSSNVFVYNGSLTQPPCRGNARNAGNITFFVLRRPGFITYKTYNGILSKTFPNWTKGGKNIKGINEKRPIQPLQGRNVYSTPFLDLERKRANGRSGYGRNFKKTDPEYQSELNDKMALNSNQILLLFLGLFSAIFTSMYYIYL